MVVFRHIVIRSIVVLFLVVPLFGCKEDSSKPYSYQNGDIIFHYSESNQSRAIALATNSEYTHMGIIFKNKKGIFVLEGVGTVRLTPIDEWIEVGAGGNHVIKRLKSSKKVLSENGNKLKKAGRSFMGKPYDIYFGWSDDKIYCSELVYKVFNRGAGIKIGKLQKLKEFDLSSSLVKAKLKERYGSKVPLEETVISPQAIFESPLLETVYIKN